MIIVCDFFLLHTHMRGKYGNLNYTMNFFSVLVTMEIGNKFCIQKVNRIDIQRVVAFWIHQGPGWQQWQRSWCIEYIVFLVQTTSSRFFDSYNFTFWFLCNRKNTLFTQPFPSFQLTFYSFYLCDRLHHVGFRRFY